MQELFKRQSGRVYQIAMLYLKNTSDAEDAWFITVTRNLTDSETKKSSVGSPWSYFVTFYVNILC